METGVIYKATCTISGKSYIGQTVNFENRKKQHIWATDDYVFHKAIRKYGKENFNWEILEECEVNQLDEKEIYWIAYYDTYNNGYNMTEGGDNATALENWKKTHKDEVKVMATKNLEKAMESLYANKEKWMENLAIARKKGIDTVKRKVRCVELKLDFDSIADAERWSTSSENPNEKKSTHQGIGRVCRGERHTCGGYHWIYIDNKEEKNNGN